ncbi:uncharacterized protein LOC126964919 [Leptidea sinapis]|uniref:uncharacterized protein LOC126964919 n=1 Tax=Leptidea sinapis TaxID=189913 RepID=UPI00212C34DB|nr:uncharacterized protein LOC126964919 [Leptidea sinapis]
MNDNYNPIEINSSSFHKLNSSNCIELMDIQDKNSNTCMKKVLLNTNTAVGRKFDGRIEKRCAASKDMLNATGSIKSDINNTVREKLAEDDTLKGQFLDILKKENVDNTVENIDMINFESSLSNKQNNDVGEIFIDGKTFEFFLNQNKINVVNNTEKESLLLKFDPLFAKRVSSIDKHEDFNNVKKSQRTPSTNEPFSSDTVDTNGTNTCKPTMIVNPAINYLVSTTPIRENRQLITFTPPPVTTVDHYLLNDNPNISLMDLDIAIHEKMHEQIYTNNIRTLTQYKEMLADKEIELNMLRKDTQDLAYKLTVIKSQVMVNKHECNDKLDNINNLNKKIREETIITKKMATSLEAREEAVKCLVSELEGDRKRRAEERIKLIYERDEFTAHLSSMKHSFNDFLCKYEKSKQTILALKANEDSYMKSIEEFDESVLKMQSNFNLLKQQTTSQLNDANQELEKINKLHEPEVLKLKAMIKMEELRINSLEVMLAQKTQEGEKLTAICEELICRASVNKG